MNSAELENLMHQINGHPSLLPRWLRSGEKTLADYLDLTRQLTLLPDTAENLIVVGFLHLILENFETAALFFDEALKLQGEILMARLGRAITLLHSERDEEAYQIFQEIKNLGRNDYEILYFISRELVLDLNFAEADQLLEKCLYMEHSNPEIYFLAGIVKFNLKDYTNCKVYMKRVLHFDPTNAEAEYFLGKIAFIEGNEKEGLELWQSAIKKNPFLHELLAELGQYYIEKDEYTKALEALRRAIRLKPDSPTTWFYLGKYYYYTDAPKNALEYLRPLQFVDPTNARMWYFLGLVYVDQKKYDEAIKALEKSLEIDNEDESVLISLGECLFLKGNYIEAEIQYIRALDLDPENAEARYALGKISLLKKDFTKALSNFEAVASEYSDETEFLVQYAEAQLKLKKFSLALETLQKAFEIDKEDADIWFVQGLLDMQQKKYKSAVNSFKNAKKWLSFEENPRKDFQQQIKDKIEEANDLIAAQERAEKGESAEGDEETECDMCSNILQPKKSKICRICGNRLCKECQLLCPSCHKVVCRDYMLDDMDEQCAYRCDGCGVIVCKDCIQQSKGKTKWLCEKCRKK